MKIELNKRKKILKEKRKERIENDKKGKNMKKKGCKIIIE
jgi:hypothetical protein